MRRKPIIVVVSSFYRVGRPDGPFAEPWFEHPVEAWMAPTSKNGFRKRERERIKSALPHHHVVAWISLLTEADRGNRTHIYRSFVDAMERRVKARLYPEAYGE